MSENIEDLVKRRDPNFNPKNIHTLLEFTTQIVDLKVKRDNADAELDKIAEITCEVTPTMKNKLLYYMSLMNMYFEWQNQYAWNNHQMRRVNISDFQAVATDAYNYERLPFAMDRCQNPDCAVRARPNTKFHLEDGMRMLRVIREDKKHNQEYRHVVCNGCYKKYSEAGVVDWQGLGLSLRAEYYYIDINRHAVLNGLLMNNLNAKRDLDEENIHHQEKMRRIDNALDSQIKRILVPAGQVGNPATEQTYRQYLAEHAETLRFQRQKINEIVIKVTEAFSAKEASLKQLFDKVDEYAMYIRDIDATLLENTLGPFALKESFIENEQDFVSYFRLHQRHAFFKRPVIATTRHTVRCDVLFCTGKELSVPWVKKHIYQLRSSNFDRNSFMICEECMHDIIVHFKVNVTAEFGDVFGPEKSELLPFRVYASPIECVSQPIWATSENFENLVNISECITGLCAENARQLHDIFELSGDSEKSDGSDDDLF